MLFFITFFHLVCCSCIFFTYDTIFFWRTSVTIQDFPLDLPFLVNFRGAAFGKGRISSGENFVGGREPNKEFFAAGVLGLLDDGPSCNGKSIPLVDGAEVVDVSTGGAEQVDVEGDSRAGTSSLGGSSWGLSVILLDKKSISLKCYSSKAIFQFFQNQPRYFWV